MLHIDHINLLRRAKELGDYLIVGLSSDKFNLLKGKKAFFDFNERKKILESIKYVDNVIVENSWEQKILDIKKYNADIFVMGDDWLGKFDYLKEYCKVIYLPRTKNISTTFIKNKLGNENEKKYS